ncbi:FAD binding domain-containing protein [Pseudonocardia acaciae]|uniref:FAD binding domain-containing protein n=1 Tax=Pseudonocardia acaciae TaxID=551276 RepID=UPI00048E5C23|nr:FAD binding domain-containing protein [Pseudonocardia acaciae]
MKPAEFRYHAPRSVEECVALLAEHGGEAKPLAGGQSLVPLMNLRLARPEALVDLGRVPGLDGIRVDAGVLEVGAMTRHADLASSELVAAACPLLADAAALIGYPAIRNRGTIGGSMAHADPAAELPCVAVTLDAEFVVAGPAGRRTVPAAEFFVDHFTCALAADEILTAVRWPVPSRAGGWGFREFARKAGDFAVAAVAVDMAVDVSASARRVRIGVAGVGGRPLRLAEAERALTGTRLRPDQLAWAGDAVAASLGDGVDRELVRTLAVRALSDALTRIGA